MGKVLVALALALATMVSCASPPARKASESEVLAATKQLTAKDCRPHGGSEAVHVSGCKYSPSFANGQWRVVVLYLMADKSGNRVFPFGADATYVFDISGKFIKVIGGQ